MAGREIKTTLIVDGEAAFKREINDAKQSIRNLGTQLTLAAAEFKKDGDAMKLMQTRAKTLKDEISAQQKIVKALEGAVKDAATKYGEGSKQAEKWQAELNRAKATMAALETELNNNEKGLDRNGKAFDDAAAAAGSFSNAVNDISKGVSFQAITSGIEKISTGFERAIQKATQLASKMWDMMREAASWADDEITLAKVYDISPEELQRMQYAAKFTDTEVEAIIRSRQKLKQAMGSSSKDVITAFQTVRVPRIDNNGQMRDVDNVFWDIGGALMRMNDEVERDNAAMKLFGRNWMELRPLFETGRADYEGLLAKATVVPEDNLKKLGALQDQLDEMDQQIQTFKMSVLGELAPSFETIAASISSLMAQFNEYMQSEEGKAMMAELNEALQGLFSGLKDISFQDAVGVVKSGLGAITDAFEWIAKNKGGVESALKVIGAAMAAMGVGSFAFNLGKAVWGFKQIIGMGGSKGTPPVTTGGSDAAAAGGSAIGNFITGAAAKSAALLTTYDPTGLTALIPGFVGDHTAFGRSLRDGGSIGDAVEASKEAVVDWADDTKERFNTFLDDWSQNNLWRGFANAVTGGFAYGFEPDEYDNELAARINRDFAVATASALGERMAYNLTRSVESVAGSAMDSGVNPVIYAAPDGSAGAGGTRNPEEIAALRNLPAETGNAVRKSVSGMSVKMDGRTVGYIVAPYVSENIARALFH